MNYTMLHATSAFLFATCFATQFGVSGQAAQPIPLASLKISMAVYGQKLDGRPKQLTPPSFGRDVKLGVPCLHAACIVGIIS